MVITYYFAKTRALKYTTADYITMHVKTKHYKKILQWRFWAFLHQHLSSFFLPSNVLIAKHIFFTFILFFASSVIFDLTLCFLIFHRCKASAGRGCSAGGKRCPACSRDHGQRRDIIRRGPMVLRQPLQWHEATPLTQAAHDLHLQGWTTWGRQCEGPTGSHQGQWPQRDQYVWSNSCSSLMKTCNTV